MNMMNKNSLLLALPVLLLGACSGSAEPTLLPAPEMDPSGAVTAIVPPPPENIPPDDFQIDFVTQLVERAVLDLAARQGVIYPSVEVLKVEPVEWPDAALGCPAEGYDYTQVLTPGYRIELGLDGIEYTYHSDQGTFIVLCLEDGPDGRLVIPIQPGERIQDGIPWMPVDPVEPGFEPDQAIN